MMGAGVIRVGLSWSRTLEPRELGLRGFRTLPPPSTGQDLIGHGPLASDTGPRQPRRPDERIG